MTSFIADSSAPFPDTLLYQNSLRQQISYLDILLHQSSHNQKLAAAARRLNFAASNEGTQQLRSFFQTRHLT
ncbi:uncharacterized protein PHALS_04447 [Plasmopara halstedii]|uniref:Uncharacterized protein n=1 Tax=Plasmopara halstedii TaxID=4781 RepID=A0A0P1A9F1_PLAHL|nr:uncharacterized protein PHALS_04447 [Plasmopara halstedii]CEG36981.1 hypothetical protein PHALS_04447 [Plasmopara halstedii]|eukprot:XP_024573350.1 hypothetical protein PHALS_04447 [Plasmopara halstedii]